jgi:hypothetical protein
MCGPLATFAIGAAQAGLEFAGQQQDYKAQKAAWKQNYVNSLAAGRDDQDALTAREMQENDAFAQKQHLSLIEEAQAEGRTIVAAQADGVSGAGVDLLIRDVQGEAAYNRSINEQNWKNTAEQLTREKKGAVNTMKSRINSVAAPRKPGVAGLILGVATAGVKAGKQAAQQSYGGM